MDARYRKYIKAGELDWVYLCNDLKNKIVMFDYPFFPFAREAWGLPQIECVNGANLKTLREIPPCGALIGVGGNHFVVALPEVTSNGITIKEVICEDRDNQLRGTTVGEPIKSIFSSQFMPASQGGSSDTAGESADAFPLPQPEDCDFEDVQLEEMLELQSKLHKDMVSFDLPEKGDGYCALLAIRFFHDFPMKSVIEISENRMNTYLGRLVTRLGKCLCVQRWEDIQFEGKFLLPACEILSLPRIPIVLSNDVAGLSKFYPDGALINCGDRFVVILPRRTAGGVEVREILCIDWYGGWWSCKPGMPADMAMMAPRQCRLVVDQDKVADDFYCDFLYDYVAYDGECAKLLELQKELPPNMILLDVPGFGRSGYFALLALQFSMAMSDNSEIYISEEQLRLCCSGIATQIRRALEARSQGFDTDDEIEVLEAVLMGDERYCNDPDEVQWEKFLNDVASGRVEMNDVILPFASRILGCGITVIDDDKSFLRGIPSCGALICRKPSVYDGLPIHRESHHYVLALPVQSGEGIELTCQEQNGRLWYSRAGRVACCYDEE
jgi:hypothetical protein